MPPIRVFVWMEDGYVHETEALEAADFVDGAQVGRIEALVVADHQQPAAPACDGGDLLGFRDAEPERLLDEHVLASCERRQHELAVPAGCKDQDRFGLGV